MMEKTHPIHRSKPHIKVYCRPEIGEALAKKAKATGLSRSTYLLRVGMGYPIRSIVDHQQVEELARINGDLGRLGGLLKLWLTQDLRVAGVGDSAIRAALRRIESTQSQMVHIIRRIVRPKSAPSL